MNFTKVVKRQLYGDWSGEDILCDVIGVLILPEAGACTSNKRMTVSC